MKYFLSVVLILVLAVAAQAQDCKTCKTCPSGVCAVGTPMPVPDPTNDGVVVKKTGPVRKVVKGVCNWRPLKGIRTHRPVRRFLLRVLRLGR